MRQLTLSGLLLLTLLPLFAAEQDALKIDGTIAARHLPYGTILDPVLAADGTVTSYTRCGDSATWTGHYLAAEAYRYHVTNSPQALGNIRLALAGITLLADVTGNNVLARCAIPADSPFLADLLSEEQTNGAYHSTVNGRRWVWVGNTSRDQYSGVFFGLATAYDLARDLRVRRDIQALAGRLLANLQTFAWNVVLPDGTISTTFLTRPDEQLALLQIGAHVDPRRFASDYARAAGTLAATVPVPNLFDALDDRSSYFKFNLDFINLFSLIRLETNASNKAKYESAFAAVRAVTDNHLNPHFNMIDRALHGPNAARDAETRADLDGWLTRSRLDFFVDLRGKVKTCGSSACDPVPVAQRPPADFLWQSSPFSLFGGATGNIESAGIDYLLPYWMARYYGVIGTAPPPTISQ